MNLSHHEYKLLNKKKKNNYIDMKKFLNNIISGIVKKSHSMLLRFSNICTHQVEIVDVFGNKHLKQYMFHVREHNYECFKNDEICQCKYFLFKSF